MTRYRLKLTSLKFISPVDAPAQETATALLLKRAGGVSGVARVVKVDDALGLVFCWAFTTKAAGADYFDLHGDNIVEADLVKVCAEFMEGARAVDEMHDGVATGQVVFGMPMTAEVAKAFGVSTDTEGFMVAIKPAPDVFAKFKDGTYTGVSIEGTGTREPVGKREATSVNKRTALTSAVMGHTHLICGLDDAQAGCTNSASVKSEGHDYYGSWHSHDWVRTTDGAIVIGEAEGHIHTIAAVSAPLTKAAPTHTVGTRVRSVVNHMDGMKGKAGTVSEAHSGTPPYYAIRFDDQDTFPGVHKWLAQDELEIEISDEKTASAATPAIKSPPPAAPRTVKSQPESQMSDQTDQTPKLASMRKAFAAALALPEEHRAHASKLTPDDAEAFCNESAAVRDAAVKSALDADPIVFTGEVTKTVVRRSHGALAKQLAEQNEVFAKKAAIQDEALAKAKALAEENEVATICKSRIPNLPGGDTEHAYIVRSIRKGGGSAELIESSLKALAGASNFVKSAGSAPGVNEGVDAPEVASKRADLRRAVEEYQKAHGIPTYEIAFTKAVAGDPKVRDLYAEVRAERN